MIEAKIDVEVECFECGKYDAQEALCTKCGEGRSAAAFDEGKAEGVIEGRDEAEVKCQEQHGQ